ncbi:MAG: zonular occludens toxin domain-containing protein [Coleofasciculus sp. G1-WW12-02]|uniref:zonular occludens toxin domain-containing protein n=1 Tax=Coleofasciculus sp. G1-WW12-02 TaxID=3068483 RepID=UPI0032F29AFC
MSLTLLCGLPGSGKSLYLLQLGARLANKFRLGIVTNVPLDYVAFRRYCGMCGYHWLGHQIDTHNVVSKPGLESADELYSYHNCICIVDELGIFFNAREYAKMSKKVIYDLAQHRKSGLHIVGACQYFEQVDRSFRQLCNTAIHCSGITVYDRHLRNEKLIWKNYFWFTPKNYESWMADKKAQRPGPGGFVRTRFQYTQKVESGRLKAVDYQAFKCFKSFNRLESAKAFDNPYSISLFQEVNYANFPIFSSGK